MAFDVEKYCQEERERKLMVQKDMWQQIGVFCAIALLLLFLASIGFL